MLDESADSQASVSSPYETDNHLDEDIAELGASSTRIGGPNSGSFVSPSSLEWERSAADDQNEFSDRPGTASGLQPRILGVDDVRSQAEADADEDAADIPQRFSESQFEMSQTNPEGYDRPQTNPDGLDSARSIVASQTIQIMPERHEPGEGLVSDSSETVQASSVAEELSRRQGDVARDDDFGVEFARGVRISAARYDHCVVIADDQNEVWLLEEDRMREVLSPAVLVTAVAVGDSGIVTGQQDGTIGRYEFETGDFQSLYQDVRRAPINAIDDSRTGHVVVAGSASGRVYLGRPHTSGAGWTRLKSGAPVTSVAVSQEGSLFAVCRADETLEISNSDNPRAHVASIELEGTARSAAFSRDGHLLAIGYKGGQVAIFEVMAGRKLSSLPYECDTPEMLYFSEDNVLHGFSTADGLLRRWNLTVSRPVRFQKTVAR
jgi:hypothetical protein